MQVFGIGLHPIIMSRSCFVIVFMLLAFQATTRPTDAAILYHAPSNVTVIAGNAFNLTCGIIYEDDEELIWLRFVQDTYSVLSLDAQVVDTSKRFEVTEGQEYMITNFDAMISDAGVYQCGTRLNLHYTPLANVTVTVLELTTTPHPPLIMPGAAAPPPPPESLFGVTTEKMLLSASSTVSINTNDVTAKITGKSSTQPISTTLMYENTDLPGENTTNLMNDVTAKITGKSSTQPISTTLMYENTDLPGENTTNLIDLTSDEVITCGQGIISGYGVLLYTTLAVSLFLMIHF